MQGSKLGIYLALHLPGTDELRSQIPDRTFIESHDRTQHTPKKKMPTTQIFYLHPAGWEGDPEGDERFPLSLLDYMSALNWSNYALFFRVEDADKSRAVEVLKEGLCRTIAQARHYGAAIEKDAIGDGYSFVKKKRSTVRFVVQRLDLAEDAHKYPSLDALEASHFRVGDRSIWGISDLLHGYGRPEAHPDRSPVVAGFQVNLVRGGLVFNMHQHHYANDILGWAGFTHQLAENCYAIVHSTPFPPWDPACLDVSRFAKPEPAESEKIDSPPPPGRHADHLDAQWLQFHLPKSKAAELKRLAAPADDVSWISTYDAFVAFIWRTFSRVRAPVFKPDMTSNLFWIEAVDMRRRLHNPGVPARTQVSFQSPPFLLTICFNLFQTTPFYSSLLLNIIPSLSYLCKPGKVGHALGRRSSRRGKGQGISWVFLNSKKKKRKKKKLPFAGDRRRSGLPTLSANL